VENRENDPFTKKILLYTTVRDRHGGALLQEPLLVEGLETLARDLQFYFTQNLGEQAWVGSKYTGIRDLTLENTKLLVKLLKPETANIKYIFHQKTLLYTKVVRDRNNVEAKENQPCVSKDGCDMLSISARAFNSSLCVLTPSGYPMFPLQPAI
jgi:hypothetical protein